MRLLAYGDRGVLVELDDGADVHRVCAAVAASGISATARPGWSSVLITGDVDMAAVRPLLAALPTVDEVTQERHPIDIPVVYDGEDLDEVAAHAGLPTDDVVRLHAGGSYSVRCLGFSRAFPYLAGLDPRLQVPRRDQPRTRVPAGSVAIAGEQAGIYPQTSPGGWQLIGRTTMVLFDETRTPASLLQPGDRVRFVAQ